MVEKDSHVIGKVVEDKNSYWSKKLPGLLDLIKIDSKWAQVIGLPPRYFDERDKSRLITVRYLSERSDDSINLDRYQLKVRYNMALSELIKNNEVQLTQQEIFNIHYNKDDEREHGTAIKLWIHVFGEYEKNPRSLKERAKKMTG